MVVFYLREQKDNPYKEILEENVLKDKEEKVIDSFYLVSKGNNSWISFSHPYLDDTISRGSSVLMGLVNEFIDTGRKIMCYTQVSYDFLSKRVDNTYIELYSGAFKVEKHYEPNDVINILGDIIKIE